MSSPWANGQVPTAQNMYDRIEARLRALEARLAQRALYFARANTVRAVGNAAWSTALLDQSDLTINSNDTFNSFGWVVPSGLAGKLLVYGMCSFASNGTGIRQVRIEDNATPVVDGHGHLITGNAAVSAGPRVLVPVLAVAGHTISVAAFQDSGGPLNTTISSDLAPCLGIWRFGS